MPWVDCDSQDVTYHGPGAHWSLLEDKRILLRRRAHHALVSTGGRNVGLHFSFVLGCATLCGDRVFTLGVK